MGIAMERKVEFSTLVRAEPDRVYDALATPAGLDGWFTQGASIEGGGGGRIIFRWKNYGMKNFTGENGGPIIVAQRPHRFAFQWKADSGLYMTTVEIDLAPVNQGTAVHLVEYGYEDSPAGTQDFLDRVSGWAQALTLMKFYVEHGVTY
jgi:uncharacterized protein YndB with AHSA1/START domain